MYLYIVDLPMKNGDFPVRYVSLPEGTDLISADQPPIQFSQASPG